MGFSVPEGVPVSCCDVVRVVVESDDDLVDRPGDVVVPGVVVVGDR